jgi:two-component system LytT family sensor kinase
MRFLDTIRKYKLHHLIFWSILFGSWYFFRYQDFPSKSIALKEVTVKVAVLASLVYMTNYWLIPQFLYKKKYLAFSCLYVLLIFLFGWLKVFINSRLLEPFYNMSLFDDFKGRIYDNIIPLFLLVSTGAAAKILFDYMLTQRRLTEISREKAETELKFLKSQINPHFLFNSLNSIYFLIDKQNTSARQTLLQFSDLLRYQLYDCNNDRIPIEKELAYLKDYIRLQQIRKENNYQVDLDWGDGLSGFSIVPLLLVPFVENAFKHISHHTRQMNTIDVRASRENGFFNFSVVNTKENGAISNEPDLGGIGLANVKRRLELLYPDQHKLTIEDANGVFEINLKLQLS